MAYSGGSRDGLCLGEFMCIIVGVDVTKPLAGGCCSTYLHKNKGI